MMVHPPVEFGIVGFGLCFGEDQDIKEVAGTYVNDPERIIRWGYHTFHRAPAGTTATNSVVATVGVRSGPDGLSS